MSVEEYLKSDRQWPRALRIQHAEYRLKTASHGKEIAFWQAVLDANQDDK